jgi:hypothetical protein
MGDVLAIFQHAHAARRSALRLTDLGWRANRRFRLWERSADDPLNRKLDARLADRSRLIEIAENARRDRDQAWDWASRRLQPHPCMRDELWGWLWSIKDERRARARRRLGVPRP